MPDWYDALVQKTKLRMLLNLSKLSQGQEGLGALWLSSVPSALFLMVPVFALLLRLVYWRSAFTYLEHLVVALYSRIYRQSGLKTTVKFLFLGGMHFMLMVFVATAAGIMMFLK